MGKKDCFNLMGFLGDIFLAAPFSCFSSRMREGGGGEGYLDGSPPHFESCAESRSSYRLRRLGSSSRTVAASGNTVETEARSRREMKGTALRHRAAPLRRSCCCCCALRCSPGAEKQQQLDEKRSHRCDTIGRHNDRQPPPQHWIRVAAQNNHKKNTSLSRFVFLIFAFFFY